MSQRDGFAGGFVAGAIFGGIVGGALGTLFASRRSLETGEEGKTELKSKPKSLKTEESIEAARRQLEDKIAQLNLAIDDVRQRMETDQSDENQ